MNKRFQRMKERSAELNQKMSDIRWCVSTLQGLIKQALGDGIATTEFSRRIHIAMCVADGDDYFVTISVHNRKVTMVIDADSITRNPQEAWDPYEVEFIHGELDELISAAEHFCDLQGKGLQFRNCSANLT